MSAEDATNLVRGDPETPHVVQLEILPGMYSSGGGADLRSFLRVDWPDESETNSQSNFKVLDAVAQFQRQRPAANSPAPLAPFANVGGLRGEELQAVSEVGAKLNTSEIDQLSDWLFFRYQSMTEIDRRSAAMQQQYNGQRGAIHNGLAGNPQGSPFARQVRLSHSLH